MGKASKLAELASAYASGGLVGMRNRIINGAFGIWQRGTSFQPNSVIYGADRFASYKSGASAGDYARSTDVPSGSGFVYSGYFNNADIRHAVELPVAGNAGEFVSGSTWTVSFWAKIGSGTASSAVGLGFADGTTAGNFGRWGSDQTFNLTTTWQYFTKTFTVSGSPVGSNACVLLYFGAVAGFYITGVQLEKGSTATSFDYRPYGTELALCQRYYQQIPSVRDGTTLVISNYMFGSSDRIPLPVFPVQMRVIPTITSYRVGGTASGETTEFSSATNRVVTSIPSRDACGGGYFQCSTAFSNPAQLNVTISAEL